MEILTERLRLRPWTARDLEALHRLWSDPETIWWGAHTDREQTRQLLEKVENEGGWWAVEHDREVVGNVFLKPSRYDEAAREIGYHVHSSAWGRGFATEAARGLLAHAQERCVEALIVAENAASQRVVRKLGFSKHEPIMHGDRLHDRWRLERP